MKRDDILILTIILLMAQAYLFVNISSIILALLILGYLIFIKLFFVPKVKIFPLNKKIECYEGEEIEIRFKIKNMSKIPLVVKYIYGCEITIEKNGEGIYKLFLKYDKKGRHKIDEFKFLVYERNKIFFKEYVVSDSVVIDVYPSVESLKKLLRINRNAKIAEEFLTLLKSTVGLDFEGVREYTVGDRYKSIDWKRSAKYQNLMVKEFLREGEKITLLLDVSNTFKRGKADKLAQLVYHLIDLLNSKNLNFKVVLFDDFEIKGIYENLDLKKAKKIIQDYLEEVYGIPNLRVEEYNSLYSMLSKVAEGKVILVTDFALRIKDILNLSKNCKLFVISLNPILFLSKEDLDSEEKIVKIYHRYVERERLKKKLLQYCPIIDLGKNDIIELKP
ncbi:protein of unknown function DUF58 [Methanocaldococcus infernus ME]|uniref:DUF58 domain-containing protein n=1 Tax=Methanocaldococcus infernus (strain DSM 11812 / JCM 15783 / ME) TaxID=573063 RepID=D5VTK2_METIM|nr:DUF58 domain-containing protein [Methanocaldococcus infernus]ADG13905.1 protein of unknown function DUF58 [Methanocaldococcus infernus ME]